MILNTIRNIGVKLKVYLQRAMTYIGIVNFGLILFLTLSDIKKYGILIDLEIWLMPIFIVFIIATLTLGYIDDKFFMRKEIEIYSKRNLYFIDIIKKLNNIEDRLSQFENKIKNKIK